MLIIHPNCEHCGKDLPNTSTEAMICSFECTYCEACVKAVFKNVCPSCGGNFQPRPIRPSRAVIKYPVSKNRVYDPKDLAKAQKLISKLEHIAPEER